MDNRIQKPKTFGQVLDHTFYLSKTHFKSFALIFLMLLGPLYLVQALLEIFLGTSILRATSSESGLTWFEEIAMSFDTTVQEEMPFEAFNITEIVGLIIIGLLSMLLIPIGEAAILFAIDKIQKKESFTAKEVVKMAFKRFWPILGSNILFGILLFVMIIAIAVIMMITGFMGFAMGEIGSIIFSVIVFIMLGAVAVYLLTRISFYFGAVVLEQNAPGLSRSWSLTKGRFWSIIGLYVVFTIIITVITSGIEIVTAMLLGYSVLYNLIVNLSTLITTLFFAVGYAVIFFDLRVRNDAEDLEVLVEDYEEKTNL
ncbi:hypothetical protein Q75_03050 [Bacillus coahuilensis p1.1.43]|uniref:Glycerophosphoryl diester phosphodiesterase membrane domain-containing protein n=1 Tax=Bacillus coahuilensis p1.1.43 TaxID=1150625 RepID=A0A147KB77_9BACI|nr:glycerophosphoryl diester phosphodiesterase membrane domain-containing protein [Bacillus coahuilensis]KUP08281.1 hypothetical protein Q75_03050 [Bacillus coahuilensis p1.1.43]